MMLSCIPIHLFNPCRPSFSLCCTAVHSVLESTWDNFTCMETVVGPIGDGIVSNGESHFWEKKKNVRNTERQRENDNCWQQPAKPGEEQERGQQAVALLKGPELLLEGRHMSGHLRHCPAVPENSLKPVHGGTNMYSIRCTPELHQSSLVSNCWHYTGATEAQLWPWPLCHHQPAASLVQETLPFCFGSEAIKLSWKTKLHLFMSLLVYF